MRHKFDTEHNITIHENEFIEPQDLNQSTSIPPTMSTQSLDPPKPLYDMIVVQNILKIVNSTVKNDEKPTYEAAIRESDKDKWIKAMNEEIKSIEQNQT